jgi:hypothetical protein
MSFLSQIRDDYIRRFRPRVRAEAGHWALGSQIERVRRAALARTFDGQKHRHQWRIPPAVLGRFSDRLVACLREITRARSFSELLAVLESARPKGVADLTVYDTAVRIGAGQGLEPEEIYLHAGTRKGAARLGWNVSRASIPRNEIPADLTGLSPAEIEDLLCIYARCFGPNANRFDRRSCRSVLPNGCMPADSPLKRC